MIYPGQTQEKLHSTLSNPQLIADLHAALQSNRKEEIRIANTGLLKAGKSTLFNCLVNATSEEKFKTGNVRTTVSSQEHLHGDFIYIDTPGIDHIKEETHEAIKALQTADIVLFVHNLKSGELDTSEVEFLQAVARFFGNDSKGFIDKTIFVMTHLADVETHATAIIDQIKQQVNRIFNKEPMTYGVSSIRYKKGLSESKPLLVQRSGIPGLINIITQHAAKMHDSIQAQRIARIEGICQEIESDLSRKIEHLNRKKREINSAKTRADSAISEGMAILSQELQKRLTRYNAI